MNSKSHILALLGASSLSLSAQMTYQGPLTDNTGAPLTGPQTISFELFATPAGGTSAWQELKQVETIDGRFSVTLGADGSINAPLNDHQYLQLTIGNNAPLSPRQQILASPRALVSESAKGLGRQGTKPYVMLDTANDRIGVNTENPSADFQIDGTTKLFHRAPYDADTLEISKDLNSSGNIRRLGLHGYGVDSMDNLLLLNKRSNQGIECGSGGFRITGGGMNVVGNTTLDATTINRTTFMNGQNVMSNAGSKCLSISTSGTGFKRPLEIFDGGTLVFGYQWNTPSTGLFVGRGTAFKPGGGPFAATSDARLKKEVHDLEGSLDKLEQLRPVTFEFLNEERHGVTGTQTGFIAQEVEKVFPEWIKEKDNSAPLREGETAEPKIVKSISISGFEALTVDAFRELRAEKNAEITELKQANQDLEERVRALEKRLSHISDVLSR